MKEVKIKQPRGRQNAWEGTYTRLNEDIHNFIFFKLCLCSRVILDARFCILKRFLFFFFKSSVLKSQAYCMPKFAVLVFCLVSLPLKTVEKSAGKSHKART